jgi:glutamate:GABA antiporter
LELKRDLGLRDLTLFATSCIIGTRWIAAAAHAGPGSVTLWILGALFFLAPLAISVAALCAKYPGAGGLYLWARGDYGPVHGFLAFWVYWMGIAFWFPSAALFYMGAGFYTLGPRFHHLGENRFYLLAAALTAIWIALGANLVGVKIGKWVENIGAAASWLLCVVFVALAAVTWNHRGPATPMQFLPHWNWETVSFWSTIAYAMSGMELAGFMGAEIRDPLRDLPRAGWIASGFAAVFYTGSTLALLVLLRPERISEMNGLAEAGDAGASLAGLWWLSPAIALLVMASAVGQIGGLGTAVSRLPFAAGVDRLLPAAFGRIHPRWRTPHISILALGGVATFLLIAIQLGDSLRAAYDELVSLMVIVGFLPFAYIFGGAWKAGRRFSALAGGGITALAIACAIVPTASITNVWLFEGKLALGTFGVIGSALLVYKKHARER